MKCFECGTEMTSAHENYHYTACGLPNVTLKDIEVRRCPNCGDYEPLIPQIEDLHRVIAFAVATQPSRLSAAEIKFLRKYLGWSGADFAKRMGVSQETVSRWEN